uniref:DB domain-containing protein n=1 Tax=Haemonchus placei TaxID=6290 RepID=A0A0N4WLR6_HAEPC
LHHQVVPECAFSNTAAACICRGTDCNDIKNTREVLAKYLATTNSAEVRNFILCFLAKGDKKSFATATKMKVDAPKRKIRHKKKKRVKRSKSMGRLLPLSTCHMLREIWQELFWTR